MILLDTCALVWLVNGDRLRPSALRAVAAARTSGELFLSPISAWEIGALAARGRLELAIPAETYVARIFSAPDVQIAPLTPEIAVRASFLSGPLPADPADRLLLATAIVMGLRLMTRDRAILEYGAQGHASVVRC